jgi:hypothetical protein
MKNTQVNNLLLLKVVPLQKYHHATAVAYYHSATCNPPESAHNLTIEQPKTLLEQNHVLSQRNDR